MVLLGRTGFIHLCKAEKNNNARRLRTAANLLFSSLLFELHAHMICKNFAAPHLLFKRGQLDDQEIIPIGFSITSGESVQRLHCT